eukprot:gene3312-29041_t
MLDVVHNGAAPAARLGVAALIVFVAFAALGAHVFGKYMLGFSTLDRSFELLYSLMVGDAIFDTFNATHDGAQSAFVRFVATPRCVVCDARFVARVYCYAAVAFTYYLVLNQLFAVMEDAYAAVQLSGEERAERRDDECSSISARDWAGPALS